MLLTTVYSNELLLCLHLIKLKFDTVSLEAVTLFLRCDAVIFFLSLDGGTFLVS